MKRLKMALGLGIAISIIGPVAISNASISATALVSHHYTCPDGGSLNGNNKCYIPEGNVTTYLQPDYGLLRCSGGGWGVYDWLQVHGHSTGIIYGGGTGCPPWFGPVYGYICPDDTNPNIDNQCPSTSYVQASFYNPTDSPTTSYTCANGLTLQDQTCLTQLDSQMGVVLSPFDHVKSFITGPLLTGSAGLLVLALSFVLARKAVTKFSKQ